MKTFTATHLNKHAQEVFAAAKDDTVIVEHDRYTGGVFAITWYSNDCIDKSLDQMESDFNSFFAKDLTGDKGSAC